MRVLAADVGEKTVGIAVSDEAGVFACPRTTLRRDGTEVSKLIAIAREESVGEIVVGLPLSLDGSVGPSAARALEFADALRKSLEIPVETWDERMTTVQAERCLIEGNVRRRRRRQVIDQVAATLILQGYLDFRQRRDRPGLDEEEPLHWE